MNRPMINSNTSPDPDRQIPEELVSLFMNRPIGGGSEEFVPDLWWWSFDTFFVKLVAIAARKLREDGHGYPCSHSAFDLSCSCEQEWEVYLRSVEEDLAGYENAKFQTHDTAVIERIQLALHRFVDRLGSWWD